MPTQRLAAWANEPPSCGKPEEQVLRGGGRPVAAELEVLVEPGRVDDLARVHLVAGVEDLLQLAERPD